MKCLGYVSGLSLALVLSMGLSGCGGGGSSDNNGGSSTETGTFVDAPVQGLSYSTATQSGKTDVNGTYKFKKGETVTFKIGELVLGKALAKPIVTPLTLAGDTNVSNPSPKAVNIARILQSLDDNTSDTSKIVIPVSLKDLNITDVNLTVNDDTVLHTILQKAGGKTGKSYTLKDATAAENEMKNSFKKYIYAGTYSVTATNNASLSNSAADCTAQEKGTVTITPDGNVTGTNLSNTGSVTGNSTVQLNDGSFSGAASDGTSWNVVIDEDGKMSGTYNWDNGQCVGTISGSKISDQTTTATSSVSGKIITVDANTTAIFSSNGNYLENGYDDPTTPYSCAGKWKSLSNTQIATTCTSNGTSKIPTSSDTVVDIGTSTLSPGATVTVYPNGTANQSQTVNITAIEEIPFVLDKNITIDTNTTATGVITARFSHDGNFSESDSSGSCTGKWISLSNTKIAVTCDANGTTKLPTSSDTVIDLGTATLSTGTTVTVYPNGLNDTNSSLSARITAIN